MRRRAAMLGITALLTACGGHQRLRADLPIRVGPPYRVGGRSYVPADDRHYDATGIASWYGGEHRGDRTASGERFDPDGISAAHRTLPLPSYVEVTALDSGRKLIVRINDRGPFSGDRLIDLSRGAARRLDIERIGSARVRVRRVDPTAAQRAALGIDPTATRSAAWPAPVAAVPAVAAAAPVPAALHGGYFVQVATFADRARAERTAATIDGLVVDGGGRSRVRIGPFADPQAAQPALARARAAGYQDALIVHDAAVSRSSMDLPQ